MEELIERVDAGFLRHAHAPEASLRVRKYERQNLCS